MFGLGLLVGLVAAYLLLIRTTRAEAPSIEYEEQVYNGENFIIKNGSIIPDGPTAYQTPPVQKVVAKRPVQSGGWYNSCSCVSYARWKTGINIGSIGLAKYHPVNSQVPSVGAIVVTYESASGHLAVVTAIDGQYISVIESNYIRCKVGTRQIAINSSVIKGYYVQINN